eukprot:jgi/Botrbrau1/8775/Bobra.0330s0009.1
MQMSMFCNFNWRLLKPRLKSFSRTLDSRASKHRAALKAKEKEIAKLKMEIQTLVSQQIGCRERQQDALQDRSEPNGAGPSSGFVHTGNDLYSEGRPACADAPYFVPSGESGLSEGPYLRRLHTYSHPPTQQQGHAPDRSVTNSGWVPAFVSNSLACLGVRPPQLARQNTCGHSDLRPRLSIDADHYGHLALSVDQELLVLSKLHPVAGTWSLHRMSLLMQGPLASFCSLPADWGAVKATALDSTGGIVLTACKSNYLSLISLTTCGTVASFRLPAVPHSCTWHASDPFCILTGLQIGKVLAFDIRGTSSSPLSEMTMETCQPVHSLVSVDQASVEPGGPSIIAANAAQISEWTTLEGRGNKLLSQPQCSIVNLAWESSSRLLSFSMREGSFLEGRVSHSSLLRNSQVPGSWQRNPDFGEFKAEGPMFFRSALFASNGAMCSPVLAAVGQSPRQPWLWDAIHGRSLKILQPHPSPIVQIVASENQRRTLLGVMSQKVLDLYEIS